MDNTAPQGPSPDSTPASSPPVTPAPAVSVPVPAQPPSGPEAFAVPSPAGYSPAETPVEPREIVLEVDVAGNPVMESLSSTIGIVAVVGVVFAAIAGIGYFSYQASIQREMKEQKDTAMLYDDPSERNILGDYSAEPTLPPLNFNGNGAAGQQRQQQQAAQAQNPMMQMMQQQAAQKQAQSGQQAMQPPPKAPQATKAPTATPVPDNVFVNYPGSLSFSHDNWEKRPGTKAGDDTTYVLLSPDDTYTLTVTETDKSFASVQEYLDTNPRNRKPSAPAKSVTVDGQTALKTEPFEVQARGTTVRTIGLYVVAKGGKSVFSVELDSTKLDVNDPGLSDTFDKIEKSITLQEPKDSPEEEE